MFQALRFHRTLLPRRWIVWVQRRAWVVVIGAVLLTVAAVLYTVEHFRITTDLTAMVDDDLPFRKFKRDFDRAFPAWAKSILVVIDAPTPEQAAAARDRLVAALEGRPEAVRMVYAPGSGTFFKRHGLLFQDPSELESLTDQVAAFQPLIGLLVQSPTLPRLFSVLTDMVEADDADDPPDDRLALLYERLAEALADARAGRPIRFSWREIMADEPLTPRDRRAFVVVTPYLDFRRLSPAGSSISAIREAVAAQSDLVSAGVRFRLTGDIMIGQADLRSVQESIGPAALASLCLVGVVMYVGLGSVRLVLAGVATLVAGLAWTLAIALLCFRELNMISIAFAVLFIGIGIDYSIQFCLRYQDHAARGAPARDAIRNATLGVSNALILCTLTTAIGFLSFVPTAYRGASQLGVISAIGMGINLAAHLCLLPALLHIIPPKTTPRPPTLAPRRWHGWKRSGYRAIVALAALSGLGALTLWPSLRFDFNPLNLSDPDDEAVITAQELFADSRTSPWTLSALADSLPAAQQLAERLNALPDVHSAISLADYVPTEQAAKLTLIEDLALFLPSVDELQWTPSPPEAVAEALRRMGPALAAAAADAEADSDWAETLRRLGWEAETTARTVATSPRADAVARALETALLARLADVLSDLRTLTQAAPVDLDSVPSSLRARYQGRDGRYLVQVFPEANIRQNERLVRFVDAVRQVTPHVTSAPVVMSRSGEVIFQAFRRATLLAVGLIGVVLFLVFHRLTEVVQILLPLGLALLWTGASTVVFDMPLNFANIIVLPLLLGIGVDYGIHMMYRFHEEQDSAVNLLHTSTARGVCFSALTTIVSFGSLAAVSHRGTASLGLLLTLGMAVIMVATLLVLPAVLALFGGTRDIPR